MESTKPYRNKYDLLKEKQKNPEKFYESHVITEDNIDRYKDVELGDPIPSMTRQGQAKTIKELFQRHREGQLIKERKYQYLDVESIENLEEFEHRRPNLDFTDLQKLKMQNMNRMEQLKEQLKTSKKINDRIEQETGKDVDGDGKVADPGPTETEDGKID